MIFIRLEEAVQINKELIILSSPGEKIGVKYPDMLEASISRPKQSAFGEDAYPSYDKAAALLESLAQNHAMLSIMPINERL